MGKGKVSSYCVIVTSSTRGRVPVSNASKPSSARARTICRMRSARKLKQKIPSPLRMRGVPVITRGFTNSSVSPAAYAARIAATGSGAGSPTPWTMASYAILVRSHRLSRSMA